MILIFRIFYDEKLLPMNLFKKFKFRLFYDEDLLQLSLFVNLLENCKALWMRINVGDYGATEYHASETGLITLLGALQKMKNLKTLYIYFRFEK